MCFGYNSCMVALTKKSANFPQGPLRVRAQNHRYRLGAMRCSKPNSQGNLRRATYAECDRLESCSKDPIGYYDGFNRYHYVACRPLVSADPLGLTMIWQPPGFPPIFEQGIEDMLDEIWEIFVGTPNRTTCEALEDVIEAFLDTPEEKRLWQNYTDNLLRDNSGQLTNTETCAIVGGTVNGMLGGFFKDCQSGGTGGTISGSGSAPPPWAAGVGGFSLSGSYTCGFCSMTVKACIDDKYDFDILGFIKTHRSIPGEIKTMLVNIAGGTLDCGWRPFQTQGCCTTSHMTGRATSGPHSAPPGGGTP
jgi:hypothetical protein